MSKLNVRPMMRLRRILLIMFSATMILCPLVALALGAPETVERFRTYFFDPAWGPLASVVQATPTEPSGLAGINQAGLRYPEQQAFGAETVWRGLYSRRFDWIETGWKIVDRGFDMQAPDGRLYAERDREHSSAFFLSYVGTALLLDSSNATSDRVRRYLQAVRRLSYGSDLEAGRAMSRRFGHRSFVWATMFEAAHELDPRGGYKPLAQVFMDIGLAMQTGDGTLPEVGGFDPLYQALAIERIAVMAVMEGDHPQQLRLENALRHAIERLLRDTNEKGRVSVATASRVGREKDRQGVTKKVSHWVIARAFLSAASVLHDARYIEAANRVMACRMVC